MGYTKDAVRGLGWTGLFRISSRGISFIKIAILARIFSPTQFGVFGIASLVLAFAEAITETGINVFLIQNKEGVGKYINTAWIVSIFRGAIIAFIILLTSKLISLFFKSPESLSLLVLVAVVPFIRGFINPGVVRFQKELNFHKEFYYRLSVFIVETGVSLVLAFIIKDPIALIWGLVGGAVFEVLFSFAFVEIKPKLIFHWETFKEILSRGKWITSAGVFGYLFQNSDSVMVGRLLGTSSLGIYNMAYKVSLLPITEIAEIVAKVTLPIYVKIADDKQRLKRAYIRSTILVGILSLPILVLFLFFPKQLVLLVLGSKWIEIVPVLQVLALFSVIQTLGSPSGAVFLAVKKQKYISFITFISFTVLISTIVPLINLYGLVGAGISVIISSLSTVPLLIYFLVKIFRNK